MEKIIMKLLSRKHHSRFNKHTLTTALLWPEKEHIAQRQQKKERGDNRDNRENRNRDREEIKNNDIFKAQ